MYWMQRKENRTRLDQGLVRAFTPLPSSIAYQFRHVVSFKICVVMLWQDMWTHEIKSVYVCIYV